MGGEMEMSAEASAVVHAPGAGATCCALSECGVPQVAPLTYGLDVLGRVSDVRLALLPAPSTGPTTHRLPPTPPPQV